MTDDTVPVEELRARIKRIQMLIRGGSAPKTTAEMLEVIPTLDFEERHGLGGIKANAPDRAAMLREAENELVNNADALLSAVERVAELEKALKPFDFSEELKRPFGQDGAIYWRKIDGPDITYADLRRARQALTKEPNDD